MNNTTSKVLAAINVDVKYMQSAVMARLHQCLQLGCSFPVVLLIKVQGVCGSTQWYIYFWSWEPKKNKTMLGKFSGAYATFIQQTLWLRNFA